ncbi:MAG: type II secretion system protein [Burkholderiaceae bacterium]
MRDVLFAWSSEPFSGKVFNFYLGNNMKQVQRGFTLIELVMVIVILGVLAAVAMPKFIDLKADAALAASQGVAGALASASAINYAANKANSATTLVTTCSGVSALLTTTPPTNFTVAGTAPACTVANSDGGATVSWTLTN